MQSIGNCLTPANGVHNITLNTLNTTNNSSADGGLCQPNSSNRLTKSPIVKKISSPVTLPAIDAGHVTPQ